jgi:hypothetical protein
MSSLKKETMRSMEGGYVQQVKEKGTGVPEQK